MIVDYRFYCFGIILEIVILSHFTLFKKPLFERENRVTF